jgi:hypothetical protein
VEFEYSVFNRGRSVWAHKSDHPARNANRNRHSAIANRGYAGIMTDRDGLSKAATDRIAQGTPAAYPTAEVAAKAQAEAEAERKSG